MSLLVVGSVAFDNVETPKGKVENALGGSALYFSASSSLFTDVRLVAVVGDDFPQEPVDFLKSRGVDLSGLHQVEGKTFRWEGRYGDDLNEAETLATHLNVFGDFKPVLSEEYRQSDYVFLANIDPCLQRDVLDQIESPKFVALDTMNFWIDSKLDSLKETLKRVDMLVINDGEARSLGGDSNVVKAAHNILKMGPRFLVIKRGEYGALLFDGDEFAFAPAFPLEEVFDPTGAGDTFAGGMMGYIANKDSISPEVLRQAMVVGCTMASFDVEDFSFNAMRELTHPQIDERLNAFRKLIHCTEFTSPGKA